MSNGGNSIDRAPQVQWGYLNFQRGRILCAQVEDEKVVLVEADGGYFYPRPGEVEPTERPDERTLVSAVTGATYEDLEALSNFCAVPRTMQEIECEFPAVAAWRLRKLGILKDVGRRNRRIVSEWAGWSLAALLDHIFGLGSVPTRNDNSLRSSVDERPSGTLCSSVPITSAKLKNILLDNFGFDSHLSFYSLSFPGLTSPNGYGRISI